MCFITVFYAEILYHHNLMKQGKIIPIINKKNINFPYFFFVSKAVSKVIIFL